MKAGLRELATPVAANEKQSEEAEKVEDLPKLTFKTTPWEDEQLEKSFAQQEAPDTSTANSQSESKYESDSTGNNAIPRSD